MYAPSPAPNTPDGRYARSEFERIAQELRPQKILQLAVSYAAPEKPRQGWVVYADGTEWNPGSGEGLYRYDGSAWVYIG